MASEKGTFILPTAYEPQSKQKVTSPRKTAAWSAIVVFTLLWCLTSIGWTPEWLPSSTYHKPAMPVMCPQVEPLLPENQTPALIDMDSKLASAEFKELSIERLSGAVKIATESYDDMGEIGQDKRWDTMYDFAAYLKDTFPVIYDKLEVETVNVHGLVYTWKGQNPLLKPTLLMAHQDVVPVAESTVGAWTHPPYSGFYDGSYIWGRGSSDCKNQLIAIMEAVEELVKADFQPQRTLVMSFGFDEEISGTEGAGHLAPFLLERYGKDSFAAIVDEGSGTISAWGALMASPAVAEKGYTDITLTVRMPGGHSSIPPDHTSIGVLSQLITLIEADPYPTRLDAANPYLGQLACGAAYGPEFPKKLRKLMTGASHESSKSKPDYLAIEAAKAGLSTRYLMQTSVAVDIIGGGVKVNALPERVSAVVNHRINIGEHPSDAQDKIAHLAKKVAKQYNLTLHAFDGIEAPSSISLSAANTTLEPAPVTPTSIDPVSAYTILSGTTRALYGVEIIMSPSLSTGNTDTRYYWDLTRDIFRYGPGWAPGEQGLGNIHTVDEKMSAEAHVNAVKWFSLFVRNIDQAALA